MGKEERGTERLLSWFGVNDKSLFLQKFPFPLTYTPFPLGLGLDLN